MAVPAAIHADPLGLLVAFGAGMLSFLSPCVLPLVPAYLSMVSGLTAAELDARRSPPVSAPDAAVSVPAPVGGRTVVAAAPPVSVPVPADGPGPEELRRQRGR